MRLTQLFLTCCLLISTLVVAQEEEEASSAVSSVISKIPESLIGGGLFDTIKIDKKFDLETKDICINIGKVDIEIEKEKKFPINGVAVAGDSVEDAQQTNLVVPNKFELDKEIDIKKKDVIVNICKVKIDIEKDAKKKIGSIAGANAEDAEDAEEGEVAAIPQLITKNIINIDKEIDIEKKDIIVNIGKVKVEIEKKKKKPMWPWPAAQPITWKPTWKYPSIGATADENGQVYDDNTTIPLFEDFTPADEPDLADEVVLGENATAITVQGGEKFDERGVLILTGPQIYSVTFKIVKEKVITVVGSDFNVAGYKKRKPKEAITFIIRGRGFIPGSGLIFNEIDDVMGGTSKGGLFEFLEPRVFLGAIPLKVVKFTDTVIIARFLDFEDQRHFEGGTHLARVKVLHVDLKKEKKKHGPGGDIGILGHDDEQTEIVSVGGISNGFPAVIAALNQPTLFTRSEGPITSPVLGAIENPFPQGEKKVDKKNDFSQSLLGLFAGLRFDTAVLQVQFSVKDAEKIKGSYNTLYTDGYGLDI